MILLLSTSDTDLITASASGAEYRVANPARILVDDLAGLADGADLVVIRILGGVRAWEDGLAAAVALDKPLVVLSGEQQPDPDLMAVSTVPAGAVSCKATISFLFAARNAFLVVELKSKPFSNLIR